MKKALHIVLLGTVALVIGACQRGLTPEEQQAKQEQEQAQKTEQFWDVVGQLVAASDYTPDYKGKTFEPVIGIADASDPQARIVKSNSAAAAAQSFADLVNVYTITEQTPTYTWSNPEVGTLTYTKMDGPTSWAEVKVDIPSIPHLSKIIYRSVEQSGENGSFSYAAYYRFGDVVKRNNDDGKEEYWVCVRPAFGPEGKEDSHWMCVGSLPKENLWSYTASNGVTYVLPTGLNSSKEHMQNFAEMLFAMCYPDEWKSNINNYSKVGWTGPYGLPIFHDFSPNNIGLNNDSFWKNVATMWKDKGLDYAVLGASLEKVAQELKGPGIHFLYKGYSWWTGTSNSATLYQAKYVNTPGNASNKGVNSNMQTASPFLDIKRQMLKNKDERDNVHEFTVKDKKFVIYPEFFGDSNPRYIVRYARGSDLASDGKSPAVDKAIPGVTDVYRYYKDVLPVENLKEHKPETSVGRIVNDRNKQNLTDFNGIGRYALGNVYKDEENNLWFVVNMAGQGGAVRQKSFPQLTPEPAPLAELISFDGLKVIKDNNEAVLSYVGQMPEFSQAVRAATYIRSIYGMGRGAFTAQEKSLFHQLVLHLSERANVNMLDLVQAIGGQGTNNVTQAFSAAYYDVRLTNTYRKQLLLRFVYPLSFYPENTPYILWTEYPAKPDTNTKKYDRTDFSTEQIYLQDIANSLKVSDYAPDFYATQPLESSANGRYIRREVDRYARDDISEFFYHSSTWNLHRDMWNEPVLMFRTDAVYDRGDDEYATTTVGGRRLTLVAAFDKLNPLSYNKDNTSELREYEDRITEVYKNKAANQAAWTGGTVTLNGKAHDVRAWKDTWIK